MSTRKFGYVHAPDVRDAAYPVSALLPSGAAPITHRMWRSSSYMGDQGNTSYCVAYAWVHFIHHSPLTFPGFVPVINQLELYQEAQRNDEWPGEEPLYFGTSVRAGAKALLRRGFISTYRWARSLDEMIQAILYVGPVVVGTPWYSGMNKPDANGYVKPTGYSMGGHAYLVDGCRIYFKADGSYDLQRSYFRFKNSWGRKWGSNGYGYITFADMLQLLGEWAEVCLAVETRPK